MPSTARAFALAMTPKTIVLDVQGNTHKIALPETVETAIRSIDNLHALGGSGNIHDSGNVTGRQDKIFCEGVLMVFYKPNRGNVRLSKAEIREAVDLLSKNSLRYDENRDYTTRPSQGNTVPLSGKRVVAYSEAAFGATPFLFSTTLWYNQNRATIYPAYDIDLDRMINDLNNKARLGVFEKAR